METFVVKVCKGIVTNERKGTSRLGYWIPVEELPRHIAGQFGAAKDTRQGLSWDTHARQWRNMKNARQESYAVASAVVVQLDDGSKGIALLDF